MCGEVEGEVEGGDKEEGVLHDTMSDGGSSDGHDSDDEEEQYLAGYRERRNSIPAEEVLLGEGELDVEVNNSDEEAEEDEEGDEGEGGDARMEGMAEHVEPIIVTPEMIEAAAAAEDLEEALALFQTPGHCFPMPTVGWLNMDDYDVEGNPCLDYLFAMCTFQLSLVDWRWGDGS